MDLFAQFWVVAAIVMGLSHTIARERLFAPASAGKERDRHAMKQEEINRLLVRLGRQGKRVVRLKGGDPFVFGRGGEEALALARAGIPFEIVPGVSSAVAAPALAGIPVTHRGLASSFAVVTGHHETTYGPLLDGFPPGALTLVVLMGLGQRARIADRLLARGWSAETPAAFSFLATDAATLARSASHCSKCVCSSGSRAVWWSK